MLDALILEMWDWKQRGHDLDLKRTLGIYDVAKRKYDDPIIALNFARDFIYFKEHAWEVSNKGRDYRMYD
jgi:hypothetical protein